jgi:hypothetical protein
MSKTFILTVGNLKVASNWSFVLDDETLAGGHVEDVHPKCSQPEGSL